MILLSFIFQKVFICRNWKSYHQNQLKIVYRTKYFSLKYQNFEKTAIVSIAFLHPIWTLQHVERTGTDYPHILAPNEDTDIILVPFESSGFTLFDAEIWSPSVDQVSQQVEWDYDKHFLQNSIFFQKITSPKKYFSIEHIKNFLKPNCLIDRLWIISHKRKKSLRHPVFPTGHPCKY